jgi:tetratricopeptide repeat protein/PEGA domain-containing protein
MSRSPSILIATTALCLSFAAASSCAAPAYAAEPVAETPEVDQARQHFGQGLKLYKDGDFDAALVQFERAYGIKSNFKVLYNIAQCYFELHQYVEARDALARYLKDGGGEIEGERRVAVQSDLAELQRRIARLKLNVNVNGATVYIDGKRAGVTPLPTAIDVNEGQRTVSIETPDRGSKQRVVRVAGGEAQVVSVDFEAAKGTAAAPLMGTPGEASGALRSNGLGAGFWVTGISALALGAGAGVTGYFALKAQSDHQDALKAPVASPDELDDSRTRAKNFARATDILAGSALVCASIATVVLITHDSGSRQVGIGIGPGHVALRGSF